MAKVLIKNIGGLKFTLFRALLPKYILESRSFLDFVVPDLWNMSLPNALPHEIFFLKKLQ